MKHLLSLALCLTVFADLWADVPPPLRGVFAVEREEQVLVYLEINENGKVSKAYPKPSVELGTISEDPDGELAFVPRKGITAENHFYVTAANAAILGGLAQQHITDLRTVLFNGGQKTMVRVKPAKGEDLTVEEVRQFECKIPWDKLQLRRIPRDELAKIEAVEKMLVGRWEFSGGEDCLGDFKSEMKDGAIAPFPAKKTAEFCLDGRCTLDGVNTKFFWIDGKMKRLSFQSSQDPKEYSNREEFDVESVSDQELVVRTLGVPFPPSLLKESNDYPPNAVYKRYVFRKLQP